jgi:hypothetical protein
MGSYWKRDPMREVHLRLRVNEDGGIEIVPDGCLPPGEHEAVVVIGGPPTRGKPFSMEDFPIHHGEWDHTRSLRREDIYGDDGR